MIGEHVEHPRYGRGQIVAVYRNGAEWLVRFESGLRFRRSRQEFEGESAVPSVAPAGFVPPAPMPRSRFEARNLVEALRFGVAPAHYVHELTIGLEGERASLIAGLNGAHAQGGAVRAVIGDYGHGKSHLVELAAQEALARNFLVATASLDLLELPPHRSFDIYSSLVQSLRYPDGDERGLAPLLDKAAGEPRTLQQLAGLSASESDPLPLTLMALAGSTSSRQRKAWQGWLMGGRRVTAMNRALPPGVKFPSIYKIGNNARQVAYLLGGLSILARLTAYSGLCLLVDEAESYSLLQARQRSKADHFFRAVIYAALHKQGTSIREDTLPQHHLRDYPAAYGDGQSLFFLFTVTRSDNRLPLEDWLEADEIIELDPHHTPQEIGQFLHKLQGYHAQAYAYEPGDRQGQLRRAAAEHLAQGMRNAQLSIRGGVRLGVELYDLLYLYPDYDVAVLLEELRGQLR